MSDDLNDMLALVDLARKAREASRLASAAWMGQQVAVARYNELAETARLAEGAFKRAMSDLLGSVDL